MKTNKLLDIFNDPVFQVILPRYLPSSFRAKIRKFRGRTYYPSIYDRTKTIFIHVPKTAGSTISNIIYKDMRQAHNHYRAMDYYSESKNKFTTYFKFSFVRHPIDRFISAYKHLNSLPIWVGKGTQNFSDKYVKPFSNNIDEFIDYFLNNKIVQNWIHFQLQSDFLMINKNLSVDFLGKFESLNYDLMRLIKILYIKNIYEIPHVNKSKIFPEHNYNINDSNRKKLIHYYYDDFINFNYKI